MGARKPSLQVDSGECGGHSRDNILTIKKYSRVGFLNPGTLDVLGQIVLCCVALFSIHCGTFSIPVLYPLDVSSISLKLCNQNISKYCPMFSGELGQIKMAQVNNHCPRSNVLSKIIGLEPSTIYWLLSYPQSRQSKVTGIGICDPILPKCFVHLVPVSSLP